MSRSWATPTAGGTDAAARAALDDAAVERRLGWVLRAGVVAAGAIVLLGLVLFFVQEIGRDRVSLDTALGRDGATQTVRPRDLFIGLIDGNATAYIQLGLLVLILTPIVRVAMTVVVFRRQHDHIFALLAGGVLIVLVLGFFGIGA